MSCDCYKIGGPWITFDPDCPEHGYEAQREAEDREQRESEMQSQIDTLRAEVARLSAATTKDQS